MKLNIWNITFSLQISIFLRKFYSVISTVIFTRALKKYKYVVFENIYIQHIFWLRFIPCTEAQNCPWRSWYSMHPACSSSLGQACPLFWGNLSMLRLRTRNEGWQGCAHPLQWLHSLTTHGWAKNTTHRWETGPRSARFWLIYSILQVKPVRPH